MKLYTETEVIDKALGEKGTPIRDHYDSKMNAFLIGEAIKRARQSKHLTQEQLGELIGVKRSQVSRIEHGNNLTVATISRVFKALNITAFFDMGSIGRISLW